MIYGVKKQTKIISACYYFFGLLNDHLTYHLSFGMFRKNGPEVWMPTTAIRCWMALQKNRRKEKEVSDSSVHTALALTDVGTSTAFTVSPKKCMHNP